MWNCNAVKNTINMKINNPTIDEGKPCMLPKNNDIHILWYSRNALVWNIWFFTKVPKLFHEEHFQYFLLEHPRNTELHILPTNSTGNILVAPVVPFQEVVRSTSHTPYRFP